MFVQNLWRVWFYPVNDYTTILVLLHITHYILSHDNLYKPTKIILIVLQTYKMSIYNFTHIKYFHIHHFNKHFSTSTTYYLISQHWQCQQLLKFTFKFYFLKHWNMKHDIVVVTNQLTNYTRKSPNRIKLEIFSKTDSAILHWRTKRIKSSLN